MRPEISEDTVEKLRAYVARETNIDPRRLSVEQLIAQLYGDWYEQLDEDEQQQVNREIKNQSARVGGRRR